MGNENESFCPPPRMLPRSSLFSLWFSLLSLLFLVVLLVAFFFWSFLSSLS